MKTLYSIRSRPTNLICYTEKLNSTPKQPSACLFKIRFFTKHFRYVIRIDFFLRNGNQSKSIRTFRFVLSGAVCVHLHLMNVKRQLVTFNIGIRLNGRAK